MPRKAQSLDLIADAIACHITLDCDTYTGRKEAISRLVRLRDNTDEHLRRLGQHTPAEAPDASPKPWLCGSPRKNGEPCQAHVTTVGSMCAQHTPNALNRCNYPAADGTCRSVVTRPGSRCHHHAEPGVAKVWGE